MEVASHIPGDMPDQAASTLLAQFGQRLIQARAARGYTQSALARALNVRAGRVHTWESGRNYPSVPELWNLLTLLGVTSDWLYFGETGGLTTETYKSLFSEHKN